MYVRLEQVEFFAAVPEDGMFLVVRDEVVERVERLRADTVHALRVHHDAEMFVFLRRLQGDGVVARLQSEQRNSVKATEKMMDATQYCLFNF